MALANAIKSLPTFGKGSFFKTEDVFDAGSGSYVPQQITIACKNKKRMVCGLLSEGVKLSGQAEWKEMFGGGIASIGGSVISAVSSGMQMINGTSIQQPWMNRKFWVSTKPFSFTFAFNFVAKQDAQSDVFLPAQALLSFIYPRDLGNSEKIKEWLNKHGFNTERDSTSGGTNLAAAVAENAKAFSIPGPSISYGAKGEDIGNGDAVTITVGNMFAFGGVYLENVDVEFSPTVDYSGFPIWCKCSVKATAMDVVSCNADGSFNISQFRNGQEALSDLMESIKNTIDTAAADIQNIAKATKNAIGATHMEEN